MKEKNKLYFMELMGDIDDRMIQEAAAPWESSRVSAWHKRSRQAAAVAAVVLLGMGCLLHTEVRAGIDKATTWIGNMLGISTDLASYVAVKEMPVTQHGLTFTLQEVMLDQDMLFFEVTSQFADPKKTEDIEVTSRLTVNGKEQTTRGEIVSNASTEMLATRYVESYYTGNVWSTDEKTQVELVLSAKSADGQKDYGEYHFNFEASPEELETDTKRVEVNQTVKSTDGEQFTIQKISVNALESTIYASCDALDTDAEYEIHGTDDQGNQIVYRLLTAENSTAVFVRSEGNIATDAHTLELQVYKQKYTGKQLGYEEEDGIAAVDESVEKDGDAEPLGEKIWVGLK